MAGLLRNTLDANQSLGDVSAPILKYVLRQLTDCAVFKQACRVEFDLQLFTYRADKIDADNGIDAEVRKWRVIADQGGVHSERVGQLPGDDPLYVIAPHLP